MQNTRKHFLDNIRWITVVLVVLYHVLYMYNGVGVLGGLGQITSLKVQYYDAFLYLVYPWLMPILFLVSGICARYELSKRSDGAFLKNRTIRLLVPSTIGLFVFQFLQGYLSMSIGGAFDTLTQVPKPALYLIMALSGVGVLWYVQILWVFSLLLVLVRKAEQDRLWTLGEKANAVVLLLLVLPVWGAAQILNTPVIIVYRFGLYGLLFFLGYFVFSHDAVMATVTKWRVVFLVAAIALGAAFLWRYFGENYAEAPINRSLLFCAFAWFACLAILGMMRAYGDVETSFSRWMSRHSFHLYVFHYFGISLAALYLGKPGAMPAWAVYLLSLAAGIIVGYGLGALIERIPFFRWAVLGVSRKK